ncbi:hypothetical protein K501DRAFT_195627 [Backusella circina FSU 941]|nr:hypothetical protein K501DRAFT_204446 [Backusella circina FSU 941]KAI8878524.1 hypothetical protein K501DRAFT_195627 [Backusella circina FSU 941]
MDANVQIPNKAAKALRARLAVVKRHLEPLLNRPISELYNKLSITERCELEVLLAYSLNTLYYIYMRTQGVDPQDHAVMKELVRIKEYIDKIKIAEGRGPKRTMQVDRDAANRFIKAAITETKKGKMD